MFISTSTVYCAYVPNTSCAVHGQDWSTWLTCAHPFLYLMVRNLSHSDSWVGHSKFLCSRNRSFKSLCKGAFLNDTVFSHQHLTAGQFTEEVVPLRALGVSVDVTETRHPVAALWEVYKSAALSKTMGKSCSGVQALCPVAWSPAANLRKPAASIHWPSVLSAPSVRCAVLRLSLRWRGKQINNSRNKTYLMFYVWKPLAAPGSTDMMNFILICLLCGLYGVHGKGE